MGDVVHRRSPDQDLVHQEIEITRGVGVVITRDQGPGKAGADQGQEGETRGKQNLSRGASPARRRTRTRTETSHVPGPRRPGRSLVPEKSPVLDRKLVMTVFASTFVLYTADIKTSPKLHYRLSPNP